MELVWTCYDWIWKFVETPGQEGLNYYSEKHIENDGNKNQQSRGRISSTIWLLLYQEYSRFKNKIPHWKKILSQIRELAEDGKNPIVL